MSNGGGTEIDRVIEEAWQRAETRARLDLDRRLYGRALLLRLLDPLRYRLDLLTARVERLLILALAIAKALLVVVLAYSIGHWLGDLFGISLGGTLLSIIALLAWLHHTRGDRVRDRQG